MALAPPPCRTTTIQHPRERLPQQRARPARSFLFPTQAAGPGPARCGAGAGGGARPGLRASWQNALSDGPRSSRPALRLTPSGRPVPGTVPEQTLYQSLKFFRTKKTYGGIDLGFCTMSKTQTENKEEVLQK